MTSARLEAFSDAVIAIVITIMVLEMKVPHGTDFGTLMPLLPVFLSYIMSFLYLGIYWNNHHHLLHASDQINGAVLWANLHLLFWLSLIPFVTGWMGENNFEQVPTVFYGIVLLMAAIAYFILTSAITKLHGDNSVLRKAIGKDWKGKSSVILYGVAIGLAFVNHWFSIGIYILVALLWIIPDRRIESKSNN
jgi:uncharacterized membrane protein